MTSFMTELGVNFKHRLKDAARGNAPRMLEAPHVINVKKQVMRVQLGGAVWRNVRDWTSAWGMLPMYW